MGRLVYVREDREAEPRFSAPGGGRGGFDGGMGGGPRGNFHGNFGGPPGGAGGGGRQVYVANVCVPCSFVFDLRSALLTALRSFPTMLAGKI